MAGVEREAERLMRLIDEATVPRRMSRKETRELYDSLRDEMRAREEALDSDDDGGE